MYRGGNEQKIREYLVKNNFVDAVIQLPENLFFGTSIATCIMVLKKNRRTSDVLFIDASAECVKVTNANKLTEANIARIVGTAERRTEEPHFSRRVPAEEIEAQGYNLSVSTYVEQPDTRERTDIKKLNRELAEIVQRETALREELEALIRELEA